MKVGTDGVLLGAWADVSSVRRILDIGTGTGLMALMLAQRCATATITAIEIDADAAAQAADNVANAPWHDRIDVVCADFTTWRSDCRYDVIVSNPPFFPNALVSPDASRTLARHDVSLSYEHLLSGVSAMLADEGAFSLILPADNVDDVVDMAARKGLHLSRQCHVVTAPGKPPKRTLLAFTRLQGTLSHEELLIETARHQYSPEFTRLVQPFYLKM